MFTAQDKRQLKLFCEVCDDLTGRRFLRGLSTDARHPGVVATLTVTTSTITTNRATGGAAGAGGNTGQGMGGGAYLANGGDVCLDAATLDALFGNLASTSNNDLFGDFALCP